MIWYQLHIHWKESNTCFFFYRIKIYSHFRHTLGIGIPTFGERRGFCFKREGCILVPRMIWYQLHIHWKEFNTLETSLLPPNLAVEEWLRDVDSCGIIIGGGRSSLFPLPRPLFPSLFYNNETILTRVHSTAFPLSSRAKFRPLLSFPAQKFVIRYSTITRSPPHPYTCTPPVSDH